MPSDTRTISGTMGRLYVIEETTPNQTPDNADWERVANLAEYTPTPNPNFMPMMGAGSRRLLTFTQGGALDIRWALKMALWGDSWLKFLKAALGSAAGTTEGMVPTLSLLAEDRRDIGGPDEYYLADLINGAKVGTFSLVKTHGNDPVALNLSGFAQWPQQTDILTGDPLVPSFQDGFQGTVGDPLEPANLGPLPSETLPPIMYYHWREFIKLYGESEVELTRIGTWTLTANNSLKPLPGIVLGADGIQRPAWAGFGEEPQDINLQIQFVPGDLGYYEEFLAGDDIEWFRLQHTPPVGYAGSMDIKLKRGRWTTPGGYSIKDQVLQTGTLAGPFKDVEIT